MPNEDLSMPHYKNQQFKQIKGNQSIALLSTKNIVKHVRELTILLVLCNISDTDEAFALLQRW